MAKSLETLKARSDKLHGQSTDEVLKVNRAILEIEPGHVAATNRLGIAYVDRGDQEKALETFSAGFEANPRNQIAQRRIEGLHKKLH